MAEAGRRAATPANDADREAGADAARRSGRRSTRTAENMPHVRNSSQDRQQPRGKRGWASGRLVQSCQASHEIRSGTTGDLRADLHVRYVRGLSPHPRGPAAHGCQRSGAPLRSADDEVGSRPPSKPVAIAARRGSRSGPYALRLVDLLSVPGVPLALGGEREDHRDVGGRSEPGSPTYGTALGRVMRSSRSRPPRAVTSVPGRRRSGRTSRTAVHRLHEQRPEGA